MMREIHTIIPLPELHPLQPITIAHFTSKLQSHWTLQLPNAICHFKASNLPPARAASASPPPPPAAARAKLSISFFTMASKITPFLLRSGVRCASRVARPQIRAFSITASRPSDTLQVVSKREPPLQSDLFTCISAVNWHPTMVLFDRGRIAPYAWRFSFTK